MTLSVRVVGVGDAFTAKYHNACLLLESPNARVLIDAPPALARALADLGRTGPSVALDDIDHVIITHLHGDHVGGLEQLLFYRRFVTHKKCTVHAIPDVIAGLWDGRLRGGMDTLLDASGTFHAMQLSDYADVVPLVEGDNAIEDIAIAWRRTIHHIPTSALSFAHGASKVAYSADTAFDPTLIDWLARADVFFHETNLGVHTPLASLVALPDATRARMRLIHYPDFHDVEGSPIACAREGDRLDL